MREVIRKFNEYVKQYDMSKKELMEKYHHTFRVMDNIKQLARDLKEEDIYLASVIALYHDIARFKQWQEYETFSDSKSFDHGLEGKRILEENHFLSSFNEENKEIILNSVLYHNKLEIPYIDEKTNLFIELVREADQLDIMKEQCLTISEGYVLNQDIVNSIYKKEIGKRKDRKTKDDEILVMLSWSLNFKFPYAYQFLEENNIIENKFHLLELYEENGEVKKLKQFVLEELERRKSVC